MQQVSTSTRKAYAAWLKSRTDELARPCHVYEISPSGAKVKVRIEAELPDEFDLIFSRRGDARISCRMVSRRQQDVEVRFVPPARAQN